MDFFDTQCQSGPYVETEFGICDDRSGLPAYVDTSDTDKWTAVVKNPSRTPVILTAIDKCVICDDDEVGRGRCDAMLTTNSHLYFVELKNQRSGRKQHAFHQLESTIQFLIQHHHKKLGQFRHKKAFVCNRKHPHFAVIDIEEKRRFFDATGFRLGNMSKTQSEHPS